MTDFNSSQAPFPYMGGKSRVAGRIWQALGDVDRYIEPFVGSAAVLLSCPANPKRFELIGDLNGYVCNAWRSIQADPDAVAYHADWPSIHTDLYARHMWLVQWGREGGLDRLMADPEYYDPRVAGWWIWGMSNWISVSDFCGAAFSDSGVSAKRSLIPKERRMESATLRIEEVNGQVSKLVLNLSPDEYEHLRRGVLVSRKPAEQFIREALMGAAWRAVRPHIRRDE